MTRGELEEGNEFRRFVIVGVAFADSFLRTGAVSKVPRGFPSPAI